MNDVFADVFEILGPGHTESVYHRAVEVSLRLRGGQYDSEVVVPILYMDHVVGNIRCDLIVDGVIVELKAVTKITPDHRQQLLNYLKILKKSRGLLVNFGTSLTIEEVQHPTELDLECPRSESLLPV